MKKAVPILAVALLLASGCVVITDQPKNEQTTPNTQVLPQYTVSPNKVLPYDRAEIRVRVDGQITSEQAMKIAQKIIDERKQLDGAYILFTDDPMPNMPYTLGRIEYGPDGSAQHDVHTISHKKELKITDDNFKKDWSKRPSEKDFKFEYDLQ